MQGQNPNTLTIILQIGPVLIAAVSLAWWFGRKFERIGNRIDNVASAIRIGFDSISRCIGASLNVLRRNKSITESDESSLLKIIVPYDQIDQLLKGKISNPLTPQELDRIREYVNKSRQGFILTYQEAQDFNNLAEQLAKDKPNEAGTLGLLILAAFLIGLSIGKEK